MTSDEQRAREWWDKTLLANWHTQRHVTLRESALALLPALLAQVQLEARKEALEEGLAIYIKAFEQNWVVQDTIDAIRSLAAASKTKGGNK